MKLTWTAPEDLVAHALVQAADEDVDVSDLAARWSAAGGSTVPDRNGAGPPVPTDVARLAARLLDDIDSRSADTTALAPVPELPRLPATVSFDRVRGAWLGRAIGCVLGKPVEKLPREGVRAIAEATGNWPITAYFTANGLPDDVAARWPWNRRSRSTSLAETIEGIPEDDDLNFTMLALRLVEQHADNLSVEHVAQAWLDNLPAGRVFTAERVVYRNLLTGLPAARAADVRNPFREWIGAQIRADLYGWARPGDPSAAARLVDRDAILSHRRDGVYGARWVAAMSAAAFACSDVDTVVDVGLAVVPPESRLATAVRFGVRTARAGLPVDDALDRLQSEYGHLHWVHVLNNAALVAFALIAGRGELTASIGLAVAGGWDTDSDGATVGAVCGALSGADALPEHWTKPLGERFRTSLPGFGHITVDELTERTLALST